MWIYIFYIDDPKYKTADVLNVSESTWKRIQKDLEDGKTFLRFNPGEITDVTKKGETVITNTIYINMNNVYKIIADDIN